MALNYLVPVDINIRSRFSCRSGRGRRTLRRRCLFLLDRLHGVVVVVVGDDHGEHEDDLSGHPVDHLQRDPIAVFALSGATADDLRLLSFPALVKMGSVARSMSSSRRLPSMTTMTS